MARRLKNTVIMNQTVYLAGSVPPPEAAAQITNESAWEDDPGTESEAEDEAVREHVEGWDDDDQDETDPEDRPPVALAGSRGGRRKTGS